MRKSSRVSWSYWVTLVSGLALAAACGGGGTGGHNTPSPTVRTPAATKRVVVPDTLLAQSRVAEYLPGSSKALAIAASCSDLSRDTAFPAWQTLSLELREFGTSLQGWLGADLLDVSEWSKVGLSPTGNCGFVLLDADDIGAFFAELSDAALAKQAFDRWLGPPTQVGGAWVYAATPLGAAHIVLRDRMFFLMVGDDDVATAMAKRLAKVQKQASLAQKPRFANARLGLAGGKGYAGYVDIYGLLLSDSDSSKRRGDNHEKWLRKNIRAMRTADSKGKGAGADSDALKAHEAELERLLARRKVKRARHRAIGDSASHLAFGIDADGSSLKASVFAGARTGALSRKLLRVGKYDGGLFSVIDSAPLLAFGGNVDVTKVFAAVKRLAGDELEQAFGLLGLDSQGSRRQLFDRLTGHLGIALTMNSAGRPQVTSVLTGTAAHSARALVDTLGGRLKKVGAKRIDAGHWHLPSDGVSIVAKDKRVVITTDGELVKRLGKQQAFAWPDKRVYKELITSQSPAVAVVGPVFPWLLRGGAEGSPKAQSSASVAAPKVHSTIGTGPASRRRPRRPRRPDPKLLADIAKKSAELAKRKAALAKLRSDVDSLERQVASELGQAIGLGVLAIGPDDRGLRASGRLFIGGSDPQAAAQRIVRAIATYEKSSAAPESKLYQLRDEYYRLQSELRDLRRRVRFP